MRNLACQNSFPEQTLMPEEVSPEMPAKGTGAAYKEVLWGTLRTISDGSLWEMLQKQWRMSFLEKENWIRRWILHHGEAQLDSRILHQD